MIRHPQPAELAALIDLFQETKEHFEANRDDAKLLATDRLNPVADDVDLVELASWTTVANVILNLDETFMKR
jgi:predicted metal-dependent HD superfamily phosphohydrolase